MATATSWLTWLSSTTKTRAPLFIIGGGVLSSSAVLASSAETGTRGTRRQRFAPRPGVDSTQISPPISSMSCLEMAKPKPVPPKRRVVEPSA